MPSEYLCEIETRTYAINVLLSIVILWSAPFEWNVDDKDNCRFVVDDVMFLNCIESSSLVGVLTIFV